MFFEKNFQPVLCQIESNRRNKTVRKGNTPSQKKASKPSLSKQSTYVKFGIKFSCSTFHATSLGNKFMLKLHKVPKQLEIC